MPKLRTDDQRQRWNAYMREYRAAHPDKVKQWRENCIIRKAAELQAQREADRTVKDNGGN